MSNTILETLRSKHEEIEQLEKSLSKAITYKDNNPKERVSAENIMKKCINKIQSLSKELIELYEDKDGLYREETQILIGNKHYLESSFSLLHSHKNSDNKNKTKRKCDVWSNFYDKLKEIKYERFCFDMTKIDIFSGFLGAGKTTLIKKLLKEAYTDEKVVLIENEFGETGIDGGFLKEAGIEITEMNSGCICCSLVGDFTEALKKVLSEFSPDRILIEPSGVGKLSDVINAVKDVEDKSVSLNSFVAVVDAKKCKMYMKNFGEFYNNQIENASSIILSHTSGLDPEKVNLCIDLIRSKNPDATIISTEWDSLSGEKIKEAMSGANTLKDQVKELKDDHNEHCECGHHHHEHNHDEHCECRHHHHEHNHDEHCECGHHHHEHEHDDHCDCGHHHHHHADEVFDSVGIETALKYNADEIEGILKKLQDTKEYGFVLRAKGIIPGENGWIHFDYIPEESEIRSGTADIIGRICVIGSDINKEKIEKLFLKEV